MYHSNDVVLIVDDSYTIRHQIKLLLRKHGFTVLEAYDHKSMLSNLSLNNKPVDLVIMDLGLKNETGYDLMKTIREHKEHRNTPIIVVTGNAKKDAVIASTQYDITYYIIKPINPMDLALKVLNAVEHFSQERASEEAAPFDPLSLNDLDRALKNTRMGQINKLLDVDISTIKKSDNK